MKKILQVFGLLLLIGTANINATPPLEAFIEDRQHFFSQNFELIKQIEAEFFCFLEINSDFTKNLQSNQAENVLDATIRIFNFLKSKWGTQKLDLVHIFIAKIYCKHDILPDERIVHLATELGMTDVMKMFLEWGLKPNTYINGNTLLHIATDCNQPQMVELLLKSGASTIMLDVCDKTPLQIAERNNSKKIVRILNHAHTSRRIPSTGQVDDYTVNFAIRFGLTDLMETFLNWEVNPNTVIAGSPLLHRAAFFNRPKIVELLLEHGANRELKNSDGQIPLQIALEKEFHEIAGRLLR